MQSFEFQETYKQSDRCTIGGPMSVTFSDIYLKKLEIDKFRPTTLLFYKRFVDDVINMEKKAKPDSLITLLLTVIIQI